MSDQTSTTAPDFPGPGIHTGLSMEDYLALPYMSASRLEILRRSPKQLQHALGEPPKSSPALERGTALHLAVLEPLTFDGHYVALGQCEGTKKDGDRCTYQGSYYRDGQSFCKTHDPAKGEPMDPEIHVLAADELDRVHGMRDAILAHRRAASLFEGNGLFEATVIFDDPETGVRCKVRPDRLVERAGMLVDLKTTRDATHHFFAGDAERRGYFRKLALYRRALRTVGWPYGMAAVLAVESEAPHDLIPYLAQESDLDAADTELSRLLEVYRRCAAEDVWPGYTEEFRTLFRPSWGKDEDADETTTTTMADAA